LAVWSGRKLANAIAGISVKPSYLLDLRKDALTRGFCACFYPSSLGRQLLCNQQLQHNEYLRRRKSLKNQIFQLKNYEVATSQQQLEDEDEDEDVDVDGPAVGATAVQMKKNSNAKLQQAKCQQQRQQQRLEVDNSSLGINAGEDATTEAPSSVADEGMANKAWYGKMVCGFGFGFGSV